MSKACAFLAVLLFGTISPVWAVPVLFCVDGPGGNNTKSINLVTQGCISGTSGAYPGGGDGVYSNAGGGDPESAVEAAIEDATGSAVDIMLFGKSDDNPTLFTFSPVNPATSQSGTWSVNNGTPISFITVTAANSFALYQLAVPNSSGSFTTAGILNNGGQQPNVSHISFWTATPIPLPATASLLLLGLAGLVSRRNQS